MYIQGRDHDFGLFFMLAIKTTYIMLNEGNKKNTSFAYVKEWIIPANCSVHD